MAGLTYTCSKCGKKVRINIPEIERLNKIITEQKREIDLLKVDQSGVDYLSKIFGGT
jgi:DNA-directed RNA polymerase subunit RPC12/RpoP